jgi:hypothetical protein
MKRPLGLLLALVFALFSPIQAAADQIVAPSPTDLTPASTAVPAAADAGAPVPTEQTTKGGCGKGCTVQSSRSTTASMVSGASGASGASMPSGPFLASIAVAGLFVVRRRRVRRT